MRIRRKTAKRKQPRKLLFRRQRSRATRLNSPSCNPDVYEQLAGNPEFSVLTKLINSAGLRSALASTVNITIFAPTNAAFKKVPKKTLDGLAGNPEALSRVLRYHVVEQLLPLHKIEPEKEIVVETLYKGRKLSVYRSGSGSVEVNRFNNAVGKEIYALNGIIHPIDGVLMPM